MKTKQKTNWRNAAKNLLFAIFAFCVTIFPQTLIFAWKGHAGGAVLSAVILSIGMLCLFVAARWHRQDIRITASGFWIGAIIFLISPFIIWRLQLPVWPNIIISGYFLGKPVLLFLKRKKGK